MGKYLSKLLSDYSATSLFGLFCEKLLIPAGMPLMTLVFGYANELPLFYIWIGFLASLAFVFHWLTKMSEWRYKIKVKGKLNISGLSPFIDNDGKYGVQIQLVSIAEFPIHCRISKIDLILGDRVPSVNNSDQPNKLTIPAFGHGWKNSDVVMVDNNVSNAISGKLKYEIEYSKNKSYNEKITGDLNINFVFDEYSAFIMHWSEGGANEQGQG